MFLCVLWHLKGARVRCCTPNPPRQATTTGHNRRLGGPEGDQAAVASKQPGKMFGQARDSSCSTRAWLGWRRSWQRRRPLAHKPRSTVHQAMSRLRAASLTPGRSGHEAALRCWASNDVKNTSQRHRPRALGLPCAMRQRDGAWCAAGRETSSLLCGVVCPSRCPKWPWWAARSPWKRRTHSPNETKPARAACETRQMPAEPSGHQQPARDSQAPRGQRAGPHSGRAEALCADLLRKSPRSGKQGLASKTRAGRAQAFPREAGRQVLVRRLILSSDFPCLRADKSAMQRGLGRVSARDSGQG